MRKTRDPWRSDDAPPRPWILWTVRGLLIAVWVYLMIATVPSTIERVNHIRSIMPPGPERRAALDSVIEQAVTTLVMPLFLLAIFGFGVFPRRATDVWNSGGPWFVPLWRSEKKGISRKRTSSRD